MRCISSISVPVSDQQRALEFYLKLGFKLLEDSPMEGGKRWIQLGIAGCQTSITLVTWFKSMPPGSLHGLVLGCENVEAEVMRLGAAGIVTGKIKYATGGKFVSVTDPDGNGLIIRE